jgi:hypothetical protein
MEIDPNGVLATPSVMIGRSSDFPSLSSPSRPVRTLRFNFHLYLASSSKCTWKPIRRTAYSGSDFLSGQEFTGTLLNDPCVKTWGIGHWGHSTGHGVAGFHRLPFSPAA